MFVWKKKGLIFDPCNHRNGTWLHSFAQAPSTIIFDDIVRVYFSCRPPPDKNGMYVSYTAYVDLNRNDLFKIMKVAKDPILPLGELGCFDEFGIYPVSVIRKDDEFWAYYTGHTRCESVPFNTAIGLATSLDGKKFKRMGQGPVMQYSPDEPFVMSGPKIRKFNETYFLFYITGKRWIIEDGRKEVVYKIRMATSNDGLNWKKENRDIIPDKLHVDETQASPDVFFENGQYHMFFCYKFASGFRENCARSYRIGYATSPDLLNWTRKDELAGIDVSDSGWDSQMVAYPHIFKIDTKTYMMYLGNEVGKYGFGLAELQGEF